MKSRLIFPTRKQNFNKRLLLGYSLSLNLEMMGKRKVYSKLVFLSDYLWIDNRIEKL